jgi:acyl-CoA thioester hydrolase
MIRRKKQYFNRDENGCADIVMSVRKRVSFSEVDAMAIAWHGRYLQFFEMASEKLARNIGLSYGNYEKHNLRAPFVQMHVDYFRPLLLDEKIEIIAKLVWTEAAKLNIEYEIKKEDGTTGATGYSVQMFITAPDNLPCLINPPLFEKIKENWKAGKIT